LVEELTIAADAVEWLTNLTFSGLFRLVDPTEHVSQVACSWGKIEKLIANQVMVIAVVAVIAIQGMVNAFGVMATSLQAMGNVLLVMASGH